MSIPGTPCMSPRTYPPPPAHSHTITQESSQRSLDRCADAEAEVEALRSQVTELRARGSDAERAVVAELETRVDELEEAVRRADASRIEAEAEVRQSANRAKRLQSEVDMMRSEYEIVSEDAAQLRGRVSTAEDGRRELECSLAETVDAVRLFFAVTSNRREANIHYKFMCSFPGFCTGSIP